MLEIDGSMGEGGGQIFRTAIAISAITGTPVRIVRIRAGRRNPGLRNQHLHALRLVGEICDADIQGAFVGSTEVTFAPRSIKGGEFRAEIGTAGSITLLLQAALIPALHSEKEVVIEATGGTDVPWSPTSDYFRHVFLEHLRRMGFSVEMEVLRRGFYPRGGGKVRVVIEPSEPGSFIPSGRPEGIHGIAFTSGLPSHVADRMVSSARKVLPEAEIEIERTEGDPGAGIALWTDGLLLGSDALGRKGVPAEDVGMSAATSLRADMGFTIDLHAADQMVPYIALHGGEYTAREVTSHARTCADVMNIFLPGSVVIQGTTFRGKGVM